jgi:hypothetical protein
MWATGDCCEARDRKGAWYEAKIEKEKGEGEQLKYLVKFQGFGKRYHEWVSAEKLRPVDPEWLIQDSATVDDFEGGEEGHIEEDCWAVEKILKKRKLPDGATEYFVHWAGERWKDHKWDSWVEEDDIDEQMAEEFEQSLLPEPVATEPFATTEFALESAPVEEVIDALVLPWVDDVGRKGAALLSRQREEFAARPIFKLSPCPAYLYKGMHRNYVRIGQEVADATQGDA